MRMDESARFEKRSSWRRMASRQLPVPQRVGEPSVFQHVLYILKENKTYDQVFGDIRRETGTRACAFIRNLCRPTITRWRSNMCWLDNYYCNGVNSADGHSWATEGNNTDHLEKSFGGFVRSYTFGDDPLTYSSSGFIWNNVLQHGLTFRNYGKWIMHRLRRARRGCRLSGLHEPHRRDSFRAKHRRGFVAFLQFIIRRRSRYP